MNPEKIYRVGKIDENETLSVLEASMGRLELDAGRQASAHLCSLPLVSLLSSGS